MDSLEDASEWQTGPIVREDSGALLAKFELFHLGDHVGSIHETTT